MGLAPVAVVASVTAASPADASLGGNSARTRLIAFVHGSRCVNGWFFRRCLSRFS